MPITLDWFRYFLARDPDFDWTGLNHASYEHYWDQSVEEYGRVFGTDRRTCPASATAAARRSSGTAGTTP